MSLFSDLADRFNSQNRPARVLGKTARKWAEVSVMAETAKVWADSNFDKALDLDMKRGTGVFAETHKRDERFEQER